MQRARVHQRRRGQIGRRVAMLLALSWAALLAPAAGLSDRAGARDLQRLEIVAKTGTHVFNVELADTDAQRARGLMFRREVPEGYGMLFDFRRDQEVVMWMENTYVSLDMLFILRDGRILTIAENTEPFSRRTISSGGPVRAVLEVVAGTARRLGIAPGDRVVHRLFQAR